MQITFRPVTHYNHTYSILMSICQDAILALKRAYSSAPLTAPLANTIMCIDAAAIALASNLLEIILKIVLDIILHI